MAITRQALNSSNLNGGSIPSSLTLPSSYTTATGDCIIVALNTQATVTLGASGCGATWVAERVAVGGMTLTVLVGYGCTSGGTTVTLSGTGSSSFYEGSIVVYSGMAAGNPIVGSPTTGSSASATSITAGSQSFASQDLCYAAAGEIFSGRTWSPSPSYASATINLLWQGTTDSMIWTGSAVQATGGTTGTFTATQSGTAEPMAAISIVFAGPASQGNMFLAMDQ